MVSGLPGCHPGQQSHVLTPLCCATGCGAVHAPRPQDPHTEFDQLPDLQAFRQWAAMTVQLVAAGVARGNTVPACAEVWDSSSWGQLPYLPLQVEEAAAAAAGSSGGGSGADQPAGIKKGGVGRKGKKPKRSKKPNLKSDL